jgi:hypothetical protein
MENVEAGGGKMRWLLFCANANGLGAGKQGRGQAITYHIMTADQSGTVWTRE